MSSEELYAVTSSFYSGQFDKVLLQDFELSTSIEVKSYILRSYLALNELSKVIEFATAPEFKSFELYAKYLQGSGAAEEVLAYSKSQGPSDIYSLMFAAIVLVKESSDYASALTLLTTDLNMTSSNEINLELYSMIVQLYILSGDLKEAKSFLKKFSKLNTNDSIVFSYSDSLVNLVQGGETANQRAFYFFEEVSHSNESLKNFTYIMIIHMLMHHFPETKSVIEEQISSLTISDNFKSSDAYLTYLINKSKFLLISGDKDGADKLISEILASGKKHPFIEDYKEKKLLFDSVVEKYSNLAKS